MTPKVAFLASLGYANMEPAAVCRSLSGLGYDGVEWTLNHFNPRTKSSRELTDLVRTTKAHDLEISEVVLQQDFVTLDAAAHADRIELTLECITAAADTGITTVNLFTGPACWDTNAPVIGGDISEGAAWDLVLAAFEPLVRAAEKCRVHLAVEGVFRMLCHDYYTTKLLMDAFDSPWLGVNFDPSHDVLHGHFDVAWTVRQWSEQERLKHVHLKDAVGVPELGRFLFPMLGEGRVDWTSFFDALQDVGYTGFCSVEFESFAYHNTVLNGDTEAAARLSREQVRKLSAGRL